MIQLQVNLRRLLVAVALFVFTGLMSMLARWTDEFWPLSLTLIVIGTTLGFRFHRPILGTFAGVGLAAFHVGTHGSGNPFPFYIIAIPWFGAILALYFKRELVACSLFVGCIALFLLLSQVMY